MLQLENCVFTSRCHNGTTPTGVFSVEGFLRRSLIHKNSHNYGTETDIDMKL